jgi:hypothetical protein
MYVLLRSIFCERKKKKTATATATTTTTTTKRRGSGVNLLLLLLLLLLRSPFDLIPFPDLALYSSWPDLVRRSASSSLPCPIVPSARRYCYRKGKEEFLSV